MEAYNSTEEVEQAESFFRSMDFHVSLILIIILFVTFIVSPF